MIQKRSHMAYKRKEPWKFIPRRDLFPDAEPPYNRAASASTAPAPSNRTTVRQEAKPVYPASGRPWKSPLPDPRPLKPVKPGGKPRSIRPEFLLLLFAGGILLRPGLKKLEGIYHPRSIQMLKTLGPYLHEAEQDIVYSAAGFMEALYLIKDVINHTYHKRNRADLLHVPSDPAARKVEAIKAMKPYLSQDSRKRMDRALSFYENAERFHRNIALYRNSRTLTGDQKVNPFQSISEMLKVIHPILPEEQKEKAEKTMQIMKIIDAAGTAEQLTRKDKKEKKRQAEETEKDDQIQKIMDSLTPMLNEEQKESMDVIMKMAQLLSQPEQSENMDYDEQ